MNTMPLKEVRVVWSDAQVKVEHVSAPSDERCLHSDCGFQAAGTAEERFSRLLRLAWRLVMQYQIPPTVVHAAFGVIREYKADPDFGGIKKGRAPARLIWSVVS